MTLFNSLKILLKRPWWEEEEEGGGKGIRGEIIKRFVI